MFQLIISKKIIVIEGGLRTKVGMETTSIGQPFRFFPKGSKGTLLLHLHQWQETTPILANMILIFLYHTTLVWVNYKLITSCKALVQIYLSTIH